MIFFFTVIAKWVAVLEIPENMNKYATKNRSFDLSGNSCPSEIFKIIFVIAVTGLTFWSILEQILCQIIKIFTMPSLTITEIFKLRSIWLLGHFLAIARKHLLKEVLGRMLPGIYNFSVFSMRDFDGLVATFTWDPKWIQTGLKFHFGVTFHFGVR